MITGIVKPVYTITPSVIVLGSIPVTSTCEKVVTLQSCDNRNIVIKRITANDIITFLPSITNADNSIQATIAIHPEKTGILREKVLFEFDDPIHYVTELIILGNVTL